VHWLWLLLGLCSGSLDAQMSCGIDALDGQKVGKEESLHFEIPTIPLL
jgi:hypothetical protein